MHRVFKRKERGNQWHRVNKMIYVNREGCQHDERGCNKEAGTEKIKTKRKKSKETKNQRAKTKIKKDSEESKATPQFSGLLEIRAVAPGVVAIKGYRSGRYLCMEREGRLLGSLSYNEADCSFKERLLSGTYNLYWSETYRAAVSLSNRRQRAHTRGRAFPPFSQFLPIRNTLPLRPLPADHSREAPDLDSLPSSVIQTNSMDPLDFTYEDT
ncbi:hypothetical protein scyTo_0011515 [Scyliorhinus torazame]|uniref:Fibroblast growth factor n=1 Tax=Scyliorhinus torazame TaxID=75743 RepID=A0A401NPE1_SCYTO|nr:hypothetical protein [Scyliorhinus torazame]